MSTSHPQEQQACTLSEGATAGCFRRLLLLASHDGHLSIQSLCSSPFLGFKNGKQARCLGMTRQRMPKHDWGAADGCSSPLRRRHTPAVSPGSARRLRADNSKEDRWRMQRVDPVKSTSPNTENGYENGYENCIYSMNNINMSNKDNKHDTNQQVQ